MVGGLGDAVAVDPENDSEEMQKKVDAVKATICSALGWTDDPTLTAVGFKSQVVAGKNYFVKVRTRGEGIRWVHVRIFCGLAGAAPELVKAVAADGVTPIDYIEA